MSIPTVGERITIDTIDYSGPATVMYIDEERLYQPHFLPIQCTIEPAYFDRLPAYYPLHGVIRVSLNDLTPAKDSSAPIEDDESQLSLF